MILLNGYRVEFGSYPNGEVASRGEKIASLNNANEIIFKYESDHDLVRLMFLKAHLDKHHPHTICDLSIRYMPYSRMDRVVSAKDVFTLKKVADFINWLKFDKVIVYEPHSDVTCALLDRSYARYVTKELLSQVQDQIGWDLHRDYLFFPDAGAQKRYADITHHRTAVGYKHRDFSTGRLNGEMEIVGLPKIMQEQKVLIVDDICSAGGTFIMAAKKLRSLGAGKIYLFVAHCENTMWNGTLLEHIDGLFCTDSILDVPANDGPFEKVHIYSDGRWK